MIESRNGMFVEVTHNCQLAVQPNRYSPSHLCARSVVGDAHWSGWYLCWQHREVLDRALEKQLAERVEVATAASIKSIRRQYERSARRGERAQRQFDDTWTEKLDSGVVYYAKSGRFIKIGYSIQPDQRIKALRNGSAKLVTGSTVGDVVLLATERGPRALEHARHREFKDWRVEGEWFQGCDQLMAHIQGLPK